MARRGSWRTRFGFYLVAVGSAFGLGNLWRFPYVVGENGGGAFVLLYALVALLIGVPILIGELILGKQSGQSVLVATALISKNLGPTAKWFGRISVFMSIIVLAYYSVISGWVLHFIVHYARSFITNSTDYSGNSFNILMNQGFLQLMLTSVHLLICLILIGRGVQEGLEKWITYLMPLFGILVIILVFKAMSLPSSPEVLRFLFYPDFSKLSWSSLNQAVSHVFFTLGVGFGTMVTFGSYMSHRDFIPQVGFRLTMVDTLVSLIGLLLLFPVAFQVSDGPITDPAMLFEVLPKFMLQISGGNFFGLIFFISLYFAALSGSIGLLEVSVSNLVDWSQYSPSFWLRGIDRNKATWIAGVSTFIFSFMPALSTSIFQDWSFGRDSLIVTIDRVLINWILPFVVLGICWTVSNGIQEVEQESYFKARSDLDHFSMYSHWRFFIRWIIPCVIIIGFVLQIIEIS